MKILITGCSGFVGTACVDLFRKTFDVYGLDCQQNGMWLAEHFFQQDVTAPFLIDQEFDCVVHLAALNVTHVGKADRAQYVPINIEGTKRVIQGLNFKKFIFLSSAKIYASEGKEITEQSPIEPQDDYAWSKWEAEKICHELVSPEKLVIVRSVNIVGENQPPKALLPVIFNQARHHDVINIFAPRNQTLQLLHVLDVVSFLREVTRSHNVHGIYNIASDDVWDIERVVRTVVDLTGSTSEVHFTNPASAVSSIVSLQKSRTDLGWSPDLDIRGILDRYHSFLKAQ